MSFLRLFRKIEDTNMNEVNENVTVNGARTRYEEFAAKKNETKAEKFIRLGEYRMNKRLIRLEGWNILPIGLLMSTQQSR